MQIASYFKLDNKREKMAVLDLFVKLVKIIEMPDLRDLKTAIGTNNFKFVNKMKIIDSKDGLLQFIYKMV